MSDVDAAPAICQDPLSEPLFSTEFEDLYRRSGSRVDRYRTYTLQQFVGAALPAGGDVCEFGVYQGNSAYVLAAVMAAARSAGRLWLFDTFEGVPEKDVYRDTSPDAVRAFLAPLGVPLNVVVGRLPETLAGFASRVCLAHVHLNLYRGTYDTLEAIYPHVVPGGMILVEDYLIVECGGAKRAVDEFFATRERPVPLTTGQAVVFKR